MKNTFWILCSFSLISCAHHNETNKAVHFPYAKELLRNIQVNTPHRAPASVDLSSEEEKSTRRVYFSSLYHQFLTLGEHIGNKNSIEFCPQFHHDKIEADAFNVPKMISYKQDHVGQEGKAFFPELAFDRDFSLNKYHQSIKQELLTMCEDGISDNFYKFDNLVTHYSGKASFHMKPEAMASVLKIPIFANFYLIKMLESRNEVVFTHPEEKVFITMSRTHWFDQYVMEASRMRAKFIRNKMVRR